MTETQFGILIGTIWIAPHVNKWLGQIFGLFFVCISALKGLGLI